MPIGIANVVRPGDTIIITRKGKGFEATVAAITAGGGIVAHAASHENGGSDEISVLGLSGLLADDQNPAAHAADHENGGSDEISVAGLSGLLADDQNPIAHATDHENGGGDEISVAGLSGVLADAQNPVQATETLVGGAEIATQAETDAGVDDTRMITPAKLAGTTVTPSAHASTHENGGSDEISVAGLSGLLADGQNPTTHATDHENGGGDEISVAGLSGLLADDQNPTAHATDHENGGGDEIDVGGLSGVLADGQPVTVQDEGSGVTSTPHTAINFVGAGVTATDGGSGVATVTIPGGGGGGGSQLSRFTANDAMFPASAPAGGFSRNGHAILTFDDTTDENVVFEDTMSDDYSDGALTVDIHWVAASATSGTVSWDVAFERIADAGQDIDSDGFAAVQTVTEVTDGTSGVTTKTSIAFTQAQADGITAGDAYRLKLTRDVSDGTMVGDAQVLRVSVRQ